MSEKTTPKKEFFDILELGTDAGFVEIKSSYQHLKKLYSSQPLVISPFIDEMPPEKREEILDDLERAYKALKDHFVESEKTTLSTAKQRVNNHNIPEFECLNGDALKLTREVLGIDLKEISLFSGIPLKHLVNIEEENFDLLPPKGYIKVFLKKYAEYLSLDTKRVMEDYFKNYKD